jgi:hypothetical protein
MRMLVPIVAVLMAVALSGCGEDDAERSTVTVTAEAPAATGPPQADAPPPASEQPGTTEQRSAQPPAGGETYRVRDAGEVTIAREGGRLRLVSVSPSPGWSHRVTEQEPREIEITFRRDGREIEFEAELEDGRIVTTIDD